ncbi:PepSY domain-containing protein [Corynebacterium xerosis]|uniref:PepSY domain-containing protein n=1 Tax=Corynebacterium xerosis TaxID=1725 RepID=UPI00387980BC
MHARTPPEESTPTKPIKPLAAATVTTAALVLAGCGAGGTTAAPTVTETVTEDRGPASASQTTAPGDDGAGDRTTNTSPATGDDPVIAAIDAALAQYPGGVIVSIDREDRRDVYDIVTNGTVTEIEVSDNGDIREEERDGDDDDVTNAAAATVTVSDAISQALDQHPGSTVDDAELDDDDRATLEWQIDLDDENRRDLAEVRIPAN